MQALAISACTAGDTSLKRNSVTVGVGEGSGRVGQGTGAAEGIVQIEVGVAALGLRNQAFLSAGTTIITADISDLRSEAPISFQHDIAIGQVFIPQVVGGVCLDSLPV